MTDYGIKVMEAGYGITESDIRRILFSSKYPMLKYHSDNGGNATINPGETEAYVDFSHSLGYVPAFIAYHDYPDGKMRYIPGIPRGVGYAAHLYAYADLSKVRCGLLFDIGAYNVFRRTATGSTNYWDDTTRSDNFFVLGKKDGVTRRAAVRFTGVYIAQGATITTATLRLGAEFVGDTNMINLKLWGMDEDNTAPFTADPMLRPQTSAYGSRQDNLPEAGTTFDIIVTSIIQEIVNRGGWASGNAMGFIVHDNGSANGAWIQDNQPTGVNSELVVTISGSTTIHFRAIIFKDKIA